MANAPRDPGLQPERTSLAWLRTLLGYGALLALALRHSWYQAGALFWLSLVILGLVSALIYIFVRQRNLMDIARCDFSDRRSLRGKLFIALAVMLLALLFSVSHLHNILTLSA
ncbi:MULTISPECIES: DUF202 domain-containing protein [Atlantibacter]|uniref:DUF202 domain-containing protein n=1 Tax=Atlantibacter hermannii NBRC 105704 TaxID=1115512 RepID=H5V1S9_ATLHE|nr:MULTISPECIES: DUF202 domain-containing protein [Atlantibacter]MCQ4967678.1 DUF202 domain-containing protein [Enterobacteriaceae bacterium DFI.7.85]HAP82515.1 DUF202 domain-containing protein [Enterobacteriaceae bacterium]KIU32361.1 membrane protein [Atlantibacter hermannii]MBW9429245.1 DUF202 domain-containing protein [Atlantibacter hermannii]MDQ7882175.1 DUF202 domain-containing protein [Atlantibacter hermannii]